MFRSKDQEQAFEFLKKFERPSKGGGPKTAVLSGYAGVGKTWLAAEWLMQVRGRNIVVVAPTNKAVDVLRNKCCDLKADFRTLDSFLGFRIRRNDDWEMEKFRGRGVDDADLVVCDEASMVKQDYNQELRHRKVDILYLGDPAQLAPIGEETSSVFENKHSFLMTEVIRQAGDSPVLDITTYLRDRVNDNQYFSLKDLRAISRKDPRLTYTSVDNLHEWGQGALDQGLEVRILSFTNMRVNYHNAMMHRMRYPDAPLFGVGEQALVNETFEYDDDTLLTNGEIVKVTACEQVDPIEGVEVFDVTCDRINIPKVSTDVPGVEVYQTLTMKVARDPDRALQVHRRLTNEFYELKRADRMKEAQEVGRRRRPLNKLAPLRHCYASTVHKAQGSTYDIALVDYPDISKCRDMRARLLYVACSRPSQYLVMTHSGCED